MLDVYIRLVYIVYVPATALANHPSACRILFFLLPTVRLRLQPMNLLVEFCHVLSITT